MEGRTRLKFEEEIKAIITEQDQDTQPNKKQSVVEMKSLRPSDVKKRQKLNKNDFRRYSYTPSPECYFNQSVMQKRQPTVVNVATPENHSRDCCVKFFKSSVAVLSVMGVLTLIYGGILALINHDKEEVQNSVLAGSILLGLGVAAMIAVGMCAGLLFLCEKLLLLLRPSEERSLVEDTEPFLNGEKEISFDSDLNDISDEDNLSEEDNEFSPLSLTV